MPPHYSFKHLQADVESGQIDTVIVAIPDMQGRLVGKRFQAEFFVDVAHNETHCCKYLIATDVEMETIDGYSVTGWETGYGDFIMKPDMSTLRQIPWQEKTALVLADLLDADSNKAIPQAPRSVLSQQIAALKNRGMSMAVATELEFFVFNESYDELRNNNCTQITPISGYNEDYSICQTGKEESLMRRIRTELQAAGIRVENTKGEAAPGQAEVNIYYTDALQMADNHIIIKQAIKDIAFQEGKSVTFMAKWNKDMCGSSSHIHQSLLDTQGKPLFFDPNSEHGMSKTMRHYMAGMLKYSADITLAMAPYVNSYKRFSEGTFAPTSSVWSVDNRSAGFRVVSPNTKNVRLECRIGGADLNPYIAIAANIAAGLAGIDEGLELEKEFKGNAYGQSGLKSIPKNLTIAIEAFRKSKMLRKAMGDDVVDHYSRAGEWEQQDYECQVTDYELRRGLERL